jgi:aspartate dehydrogenase
MACAALAGHNLGFDKVVARLVADDRLNSHNIGPFSLPDRYFSTQRSLLTFLYLYSIVEIEVHGPETPGYGSFIVKTERINPAPPGAVTGQQTYLSFLSSLLRAHGRGSGVHFC